jgi:hypothetical protein
MYMILCKYHCINFKKSLSNQSENLKKKEAQGIIAVKKRGSGENSHKDQQGMQGNWQTFMMSPWSLTGNSKK